MITIKTITDHGTFYLNDKNELLNISSGNIRTTEISEATGGNTWKIIGEEATEETITTRGSDARFLAEIALYELVGIKDYEEHQRQNGVKEIPLDNPGLFSETTKSRLEAILEATAT